MFPANTKILVVDDMRGVRMAMTRNLKELGFTDIFEAESGSEALTKIESLHKNGVHFGLIILDLHMPEMTGLELLAQLKGKPYIKDCSLMALTAESDKDVVVEAVGLGVDDYVIKPINLPTLKNKLATLWKIKQDKKK